MKLRFIALGSLLSCALLVACGGGGSSGGGGSPIPVQSNPPATHYTAKLVFVGSLSGTVQAELRRVQELHSMDAGAPIPIMVVSAPEAGLDASHFGGQVEAEVSPFPSVSPPVTFSNTNPDAVIATPAPTASPNPLPTGVIAEGIVSGSNAIQSQQSGTASATIGDPVNQTPTAPVYSYMSIVLDTGSGGPGGVMGFGYAQHTGWKWANSTWAPDDNSTDADIYIDASGTVYVPGGDVRISTDTPFNAVTATQWSSAETSFALADAITQNPDGSNNGLVIGKTRDGSSIFKLFPNTIEQGVGYFGAIEVSGASIDGF